ncbi:saccharopine dehydrogenase NADP-binding domain-containing protein [Amycolatopsis australiensis]|uniref:Saccharopine dehydrogenase NADP binding domain-containing protein n=1 Tax=Amycolatopsis australiensis TaxID=546364 RepID=A0A1K1R915_9PSEU|nr:saccharopine dehydrogenase NADP-binding domain-containing protein [Amycolatopsis australiensis]SFW68396.1 Saccharopine dehydrogenase NADP binding domain-containing protein [Amycolatopsis australiensis]
MTSVLVYGAYGHTGRFVVSELRERGFEPILSGRDATKLPSGGRAASVDDPASLDRALDGAAAVINCAGPFAATAGPVLDAAARAGVPYVDVAAEIEANLDTFARDVDTVAVPAMAFFGGLGDLLATTAMGDWTAADEIHVAYGLTGWRPTAGTLAAGRVSRERRGSRRVRYAGGGLEYRDDALPTREWAFPAPLGTQPVLAEFSMADIVTIPRHLDVPEVTTYMTTAAAGELSAAGERDAAETFVVDVRVRAGGEERRIVARGEDIYAVTAPLAVEAVERVLSGRTKAKGVAAAGEIFDAPDFLRALEPHITLG